MSKKFFSNKYVPHCQQHNTLQWFEHGVLLTYIDALKCEPFLQNSDENFTNVEVINFDIIHNRCRGDSLENSVQNYEAIVGDNFEFYPQKEKVKCYLLQ